MKDLISKLAFGFLMAQFVPGLIAVSSITYGTFTITQEDSSIKKLLKAAGESWFSESKSELKSTPVLYILHEPLLSKEPERDQIKIEQIERFEEELGAKSESKAKPVVPKLTVAIIFVALCTGMGMLIHGIHWAVLSYLETFLKEKGGRRKICDIFWHKWPVFIQIILGPLFILVEIFGFFLTGKKIYDLATHENVPHINKDKIEVFHFVQDFYLHFAQFYAHTSYALLISLVSLLVVEYSTPRITMNWFWYVFMYSLVGVFYVIGRIQLTSLFRAEEDILKAQQ